MLSEQVVLKQLLSTRLGKKRLTTILYKRYFYLQICRKLTVAAVFKCHSL